MPREIKKLIVRELEDKFNGITQTGCVVIGYQGLKAAETKNVRQTIREKGGDMTVVKNSLFALALEKLGAGELKSLLQGPVAVVRAANLVEAAKLVKEVADTYTTVQVRGAYAEGGMMGPEDVDRLARIPSRETLLSMVAGALMAPLRQLAYGLLAKPRALLNGLEQLKERAEAEGVR